MKEPRGQNGVTVSSNCDTNVNYNQGCGSSFSKANSYGAGFNKVGGGWFVLERSAARGINVWFWARNDPSVPLAVSQGTKSIYPDDSWGRPEARFAPDTCAHSTYFDKHVMIFDTTFCGDWAGATFNSAGCPGNCNNYVNTNPDKFKEAYWEINSLRVYE
ncbi:hypothetical protein H0H81_006027 [Sphagnurus paluster]|uniref:Uncharacterized protein n=1 Tax=Sphagnurus paluster TaxID=117069 RepID=A0A9P7FY93_9AGAR|nr:hypothetical protein H0H81_006027 [Sphagnurus paluster]